MGFIGHCRIEGFEYDAMNINLVAQTTDFFMAVYDILNLIIALFIFVCTDEFCLAVYDILSIIILLFISFCTQMFISSYAPGSRAI
jgi:hypothetical protein